jgi:hypothetical protein
MFTVFGDESADAQKKRVFAVAGLFGNAKDWQEFESEWFERTGGKVFHAADCESDRKEFSGIAHADNLRLYKDLTHILCKSRLLGFCVAIDLAGHRVVFPGVPDDIPYYMCFRDVIRRCAKHAYLSIEQEQVRFVFDSRIESNQNAGMLYDYMANLAEWKYSSVFEEVTFETRHKHIGIQAADLVAREGMKDFDNVLLGNPRPRRRSMQVLVDAHRFGFDFYHGEAFDDFRKRHAADIAKSGADYARWLKAHNIKDGVGARHRYLIETES